MRQLYFLMCALAATLTCAFGEGLVSSTRQRLNLDGVWQFQLDPEDQGEKLGWGSDRRALSNTIRVPGIWQTQGFGEPRGQLRHDYQGAVWYKRTFTIPAEWKGREIWLHVGGILRRAQIYLNGKNVGSHDGMMTAFRVDLRDALLPGQFNSLVIRVDNRMRSGKYTPVPQGATPSRKWDFSSPLGAFNFVGNWGGIYRSVFLESTERILLAHRNHPSLFAMALGNEFNLHRDFDTEMEKSAFLSTVEDLHRLGRRLAPHIFIISNAGYPLFPSDLIASYKGTIAGVPTLKHESGGYHDSLPDIDLAERFTGVLNSDQLAERGRWVEENGLKAIYPTLRKHSERLQQMERKWHFERVRSIPEFSGYQFWPLIDSPADHYQDSWEDGLLNYFGEPKAITKQEMQQINAPTVVLIGSGVEDRAFWADRGARAAVTADWPGCRRPEWGRESSSSAPYDCARIWTTLDRQLCTYSTPYSDTRCLQISHLPGPFLKRSYPAC